MRKHMIIGDSVDNRQLYRCITCILNQNVQFDQGCIPFVHANMQKSAKHHQSRREIQLLLRVGNALPSFATGTKIELVQSMFLQITETKVEIWGDRC